MFYLLEMIKEGKVIDCYEDFKTSTLLPMENSCD